MTGFWDGRGISWTICKQSAPHSRQLTIPTPHHSIFTGRMLFLAPNQQRQSTEGIVNYWESSQSDHYMTENDSDNWQLWCCCIKWPETQQIPTYPRWSSRTCFSTAGQVLYSLPQPGQVHLKNTRFDVYNIISTACWNKSVFIFLHHCKHDTGRTCCWPPCCCAQGSESSHVCCRCPVRQLINIVCPRGPRQQPAAVGKRDRQTDTTPSQTLPHTMQAVSIRTIYSAVQSQTRSPQQAQAHLRGPCPLPQMWPQQVPEEVIWRLWTTTTTTTTTV